MFGFLNSLGDDPTAKALAERALTKVGNDVSWDRIEIRDAKSNDYTLNLIYRAPGPDSAFNAAIDTRKIARAVLDELMASGHNPSHEGTVVWVWAQVPSGRGETGTQLIRIYGHTEYNADNDALEFKLWKP